MAIVVGESHKKVFNDYANELHNIANPSYPGAKEKPAIEALSVLFTRFMQMQIPFCDLDRFCYFLIKEAAHKISNSYYEPYTENEKAWIDEDEKQHEDHPNTSLQG